MKSKLLLNEKARNHIKIMPLTDVVLPEDEGDKIRWCEAQYNLLLNSNDAKRLYYYKNVRSGILIAVWELNDLYYIIQSIRNEFKTYNNVIYIHNEKNDCINIAKFLRTNMTEIMADYKQQILDAKDYLAEHPLDTAEHPLIDGGADGNLPS